MLACFLNYKTKVFQDTALIGTKVPGFLECVLDFCLDVMFDRGRVICREKIVNQVRATTALQEAVTPMRQGVDDSIRHLTWVELPFL